MNKFLKQTIRILCLGILSFIVGIYYTFYFNDAKTGSIVSVLTLFGFVILLELKNIENKLRLI